MPNRILKESICASSNIDQLSHEAESFFYRLIVNSDDYGRFDGRPTIIISRCYPLRIKTVDEEDIVRLLTELAKAQLISLYKKDGKYLIQISTWDKHQQIRAKKSKYPSIDNTCILLLADDIRNQMISDGCICPRNPIQSNPIVIRNPIHSEDNNGNGKKETKQLINTKIISNIVTPLKDYDNVTMTDNDYHKLIKEFGEDGTKTWIEKLSFYKRSKGKKYKDDYATILTWDRKDKKKQLVSTDLDKFTKGIYGKGVQV